MTKAAFRPGHDSGASEVLTERPIVPADVTAIVLTFNEEINVGHCLASLAGLCEAIFVVDSGSTDGTLAIVRQYADRVLTHAFEGFTQQWEWALRNLPIATEWVLALDADLMLSEQAKREIYRIAARREGAQTTGHGVNGYCFTHKVLFRGKPVRGFKTSVVHLFRGARVSLDRGEEHQRFVVEGGVAMLRKGVIVEYNRKDDDLDFWIDKHQHYAVRLAREEVLRSEGHWRTEVRPSLFGDPTARVMWLKHLWFRLPLYVRPLLYFFYRYIIRLGALDGKEGFIFHFLQALWFRMIIDIRVDELRRNLRSGSLSMQQLADAFNPSPE